MQLDNRYSLQIKVARLAADNDGYDKIFDSVNEMLADNPDSTGDFVFCVIDGTTGETADNTAMAYTNVNDAYTAYTHIKD